MSLSSSSPRPFCFYLSLLFSFFFSLNMLLKDLSLSMKFLFSCKMFSYKENWAPLGEDEIIGMNKVPWVASFCKWAQICCVNWLFWGLVGMLMHLVVSASFLQWKWKFSSQEAKRKRSAYIHSSGGLCFYHQFLFWTWILIAVLVESPLMVSPETPLNFCFSALRIVC